MVCVSALRSVSVFPTWSASKPLKKGSLCTDTKGRSGSDSSSRQTPRLVSARGAEAAGKSFHLPPSPGDRSTCASSLFSSPIMKRLSASSSGRTVDASLGPSWRQPASEMDRVVHRRQRSAFTSERCLYRHTTCQRRTWFGTRHIYFCLCAQKVRPFYLILSCSYLYRTVERTKWGSAWAAICLDRLEGVRESQRSDRGLNVSLLPRLASCDMS